ncbi:MAG: hypothetical protein AAGK00_13475 [Pseudomonadota bacterium]
MREFYVRLSLSFACRICQRFSDGWALIAAAFEAFDQEFGGYR